MPERTFQVLETTYSTSQNTSLPCIPGDTKDCHLKKKKVLFVKEGEHRAGAEGEGEAGSLLSTDPNTGHDPRTLRSQPEPKFPMQGSILGR